jgi:Tol biopolymer transport system component
MVIVGTNNSDVINGTAQGDVIYGLGGNNTINAVGGNNILIGNDLYQSSIALAPTITSPSVFFSDSDPTFSPDGTKLAYWGEDINTGYYAIYVANLVTGTVTQEGGPGFQYPGATQLSWSPNGTELAISTSASGQGATNSNGNIFVLNLSTNQFTLVSANAAGVPAAYNGSEASAFSYDPVFSPDGNEVLFNSNANNLVAGSTAGGQQEVYLKNLTTGAVTEISTGSLGNQGAVSSAATPQGSKNAVFSADGTEVAFQSDDNNLTADTPNNNGLDQIYVKNLLNGDLNLESQYVSGGTR